MKKITVILLALVIALGMTATAFAANPKITDQIAAVPGADVGEKGPGYEIWLPLVKDAFGGATDDLTMADVKTSKITVKQTVKSGPKAIKSVELKANSSGVACILLKLADPFTSTKPLDFETNIYLSINNKRQSFTTNVTGTINNQEIYVDSDTDYVDLSSGRTATCEETTGKIEVYLGNDITIFTKMLKGKQYYGSVSRDPDSDDDAIFDEYPDVEDVYKLTTINLNGSGKTVQIDVGDGYYVYGKNLEYLGKTGELIPYSDKYYLAAKKLDIVEPDDEAAYDDETDEEITEPEDVVGQDILPAVAPGSGNGNNPDTGDPRVLGVSIAAGIVSLAVLAMLSYKGKK